MDTCVFCEIVAGRAPATHVAQGFRQHGKVPGVIAIVPLNPVVPGHVLFIPTDHVANAAEAPGITAAVFGRAAHYAQLAADPFNLITSAGPEATQTVFHLHVHYVPRAADDGLMLPWGTLHGENPSDPHRCRGMLALQRRLDGNFDAYGSL